MEQLERYYRFHATIYDATRWLFLFGREGIIREIRARLPEDGEIVEIGCGTGRNLARLATVFRRPGSRGSTFRPRCWPSPRVGRRDLEQGSPCVGGSSSARWKTVPKSSSFPIPSA